MQIIPKDAYIIVEGKPVQQIIAMPEDIKQTNQLFRYFVISVGEGRLMMDGTRAPLSASAGEEVFLDDRIPRLPLRPDKFGNKQLFIVDAAAVMGVIVQDATVN